MKYSDFAVYVLCGLTFWLLADSVCDGAEIKKLEEPSGRSAENCLYSLDLECLKFNLVKNMDKVIHQRSFALFEGVELEQIPGTERQTGGKALTENDLDSILPKEPEKREEKLISLFQDKIGKVLGTRSLKMSLGSIFPGAYIRVARAKEDSSSFKIDFHVPEDSSSSVGDAKARTGPAGIGLRKWLPIFAFFGMNVFTLSILALGSIKFLAAKALLIGKLALVLSSIIGLKKLFGGPPVTYEVVSHPHYNYHDGANAIGHGAEGVYQSRSLKDESESKAYRGQDKQ